MNNENMYEIELTIPIRFSRQRITELLVSARQRITITVRASNNFQHLLKTQE
jgi:hypothetical protein